MKTKVYKISELNDEASAHISEAAGIISSGGLVAFPTETVYGLGANALDEAAVERIYCVKGRPKDNPFIVHIADISSLKKITFQDDEVIYRLALAFWPGPLTLVLQKLPVVPDVTTAGLETVAVRMPDHPVALELIKRSGCPIAAPSANLSGRPSPTKGIHVEEDLTGRIPMILSADDCKLGIESTVLDISRKPPVILRPGFLSPKDLTAVIDSPVLMDSALYIKEGTPRSPGMKYTHYAPLAEMVIIKGRRDRIVKEIAERKKREEALGKKVGVILFGESDYKGAAEGLFSRLRDMDDLNVDLILAGALDESDDLGFAVMNRMLKSAGYRVIKV